MQENRQCAVFVVGDGIMYMLQNPQTDPLATERITKAFDLVDPHWLRHLSQITVWVADRPFSQVTELDDFRERTETLHRTLGQPNPPWNVVEAVFTDDLAPVLWVHPYDRHAEYYTIKTIHRALACELWHRWPEVHGLVARHAPHLAERPTLMRLLFADTFARYYLNPEWLRSRKRPAWEFMNELDRSALAVA